MSERGAPLVSVVIPAHNAGKSLAAALHSVAQQDYSPIEIIVVDDGSTDDTVAVARAFRPAVRIISQPQSGAGGARNAGVAVARGELLAFLDADDLMVQGALGKLAGMLLRSEDLDLVYGEVIEFHETLQGAAVERPPVAAALPGSTQVRKCAFDRVGPFRTDLRIGEFIDWGARAKELGLKAAILREPVLRRRIHGGNTGMKQRDARADYAVLVRDALKRRRERST